MKVIRAFQQAFSQTPVIVFACFILAASLFFLVKGSSKELLSHAGIGLLIFIQLLFLKGLAKPKREE
jgi:hypothetical protein